MSEGCNNECGSCGRNCGDRKEKNSFLVEQNSASNIKHVIGVVSGKGGVGKSLVTSLLASEMRKRGKRVAILDGDITGPSIPKAFGISEKAEGNAEGVFPVMTKTGIEIMSLNLLGIDETQPVIWRGPILANSVKEFWSEVFWGDIDYMFVDMPPGTGDVPLTVFQSIPLDGIVMVTSPQELVSMIVEKAVNMAKQMNVPILGLVENMSYLICPDCGKKINVFGESTIDKVAEKFGIENTAAIPIDSDIALACDKGQIETVDGMWIKQLVDTFITSY